MQVSGIIMLDRAFDTSGSMRRRSLRLHELGHALGLGHATNLLESTDLMGYGWDRANGIEPVLSDCDLDGIRYVFQWAVEGVEPYEPAANGPYDCSLD